MVTIKQIADQAGVSATTVSNVLHNKREKVSPETVEKIQKLLDENHYIPRLGLRTLSNKRSRIICVLINTSLFVERVAYERPFYGNMVGYLEKFLREKGYYIMICADKNIEKIEKMTVGWDVDGIISISIPYKHFKNIEKISDKPIVSIDMDENGRDYMKDCYNVTSGAKSGGKMMADYLIKNKVKRIVYLYNHTHGADYSKYLGVKKAVEDSERKIQLQTMKLPGEYSGREKILEETARYVNTDTVLFFSTDLNAAEGISFFQKKKVSIPEEISIVGFDDDIYANLMYPPITTIRVNICREAEIAVEILMDLIEGKSVKKQEFKTKTVLVERQSVKKY